MDFIAALVLCSMFHLLNINATPSPTISSTESTSSSMTTNTIIIPTHVFRLLIGITIGIIACCFCVLISCFIAICYHYQSKSPKIIEAIEIECPKSPSNRTNSRSHHSKEELIIDMEDRGSPSSNSVLDFSEDLQLEHGASTHIEMTENIPPHSTKLKQRSKSQRSSRNSSKSKKPTKRTMVLSMSSVDSMKSPSYPPITSPKSISLHTKHLHDTKVKTLVDDASGEQHNSSSSDDDDEIYDNKNTTERDSVGIAMSDDEKFQHMATLQRRVTAGAAAAKMMNNGYHRRFDSEELYAVPTNPSGASSDTPLGATRTAINSMNVMKLINIHDESKLDDGYHHRRDTSGSISTLTLKTRKESDGVGIETGVTGASSSGLSKKIRIMSPATTAKNTNKSTIDSDDAEGRVIMENMINGIDTGYDELTLEMSSNRNHHNSPRNPAHFKINSLESKYTMDGHRRSTMFTVKTQETLRSEGIDKGDINTHKNYEQLQYEINQRNIPDIMPESDFQDDDDMKSIHHHHHHHHHHKKRKHQRYSNRSSRSNRSQRSQHRSSAKVSIQEAIKEDVGDNDEDVVGSQDDDEDVLIGLETLDGDTSCEPSVIADHMHDESDKIKIYRYQQFPKSKSFDVLQPSSPFHQSGNMKSQYHTKPNLKYVQKKPPIYAMPMNVQNDSSPHSFNRKKSLPPSPPFIVDDKESVLQSKSVYEHSKRAKSPPPIRFIKPNQRG